MTSQKPRAVMLVSNSCTKDTRVIRAAEAVASLGYDTIVLAVADAQSATAERRNGVFYLRCGSAAASSPGAHTDATDFLLLDDSYEKSAQLAAPASQYLRLTKSALLLGRAQARKLTRFAITKHSRAKRSVRKQLSSMLAPALLASRLKKLFKDEILKLNPDVIHAHDLATLPAAATAARILNARLIYDSHELEVHRNSRTLWQQTLVRHIERRYIGECANVITVSDSIADYLAEMHRIPRPAVVMNAPDLNNAQPCSQDVRRVLRLGDDIPLAIYVGRITIGRGIEQFVSALEHIPNFHAVLVGDVHKPTLEAAFDLASSKGLSDRLHVLSPVPPNEVVSFIRSADVSVVPIQRVCLSYYYCLPNKLLESAAAGLPLVVSDFPELRRFIATVGGGLVMDETNPEKIAMAVREAYQNRQQFRLNKSGLSCLANVYGWERQLSVLSQVYNCSTPLRRRV